MATVTIVITDLPKGRGCTVQTDAAAPAIGQPRTPAQALFTDLDRIMRSQSCGVQYGNGTAALAGDLVKASQA